MKFIADLHVHSHYSRATSRDLDPEHLSLWAQKKGIALVGTGDFTHPGWLKELRERLIAAEDGLYRLRSGLEKGVQKDVPTSCHMPTRFILSGEISCIYKRGGKTRKVHHLILMPDFQGVERLHESLKRIGNITSDGRPILGLDSRDLMEIVLETDERAFFIPAHIWTPWFSLFGSKSGFDSIEECFGDLAYHIHALETGLSSDPPMNRRLSSLDNCLLVSNSDAHSPQKLGREANIFDTALDYDAIRTAMIRKEGFSGTIEFFPEEGKYHLDGHRKCRQRCHPGETRGYQGACPVCGKPLTVGVLHRVEELSDRDEPRLSKAFHSLIPLPEILSEICASGPSSKKVTAVYEDLLAALGPELRILMDVPLREIEAAGGPLLGEAVRRMRENRVIREEGYDGEYGVIRLFHEGEKQAITGQSALFAAAVDMRREEKRPPEKRRSSPREKAPPLEPERPVVSDPILGPLNPEQKEAVLHLGGHLLVVAGPGTGKTMTLAHRIAFLLRSGEARPEEILALTFTHKAAQELRARIGALLSQETSREIHVATFHAFCLEVLREEATILGLPKDFSLCSEPDAALLAQQVASDSGKGKQAAGRFLKKLHRLKAVCVLGCPSDPPEPRFLPLLESYREKLRGLGMLDLDDLEIETLGLFKGHPETAAVYGRRFPWLFVDEYQDTNPIQVAILKAMVNAGSSSPCTMPPAPCTAHIFAIGDPDQAIYGFRGADVESFHRFEEDFPGAGRCVLLKNYRSAQVLLDCASALMGRDKGLEGSRGRGGPVRTTTCRTDAEEAEMVVEQIERLMGGSSYFSLDSGRVSSHEQGENLAFGDMAVLFRLNVQGEALEKAFRRSGIPYVRSGEKPLVSLYPVSVLWRFFQALRYRGSEYHVKAYLDLAEVGEKRGREILGRWEGDGALPALIDRAADLHGFDLSSEESKGAVGRLKRIAEAHAGDIPSFLDAITLDRGIDHTVLSGERVALMSLHASKGLEWPVVFITGCDDKLLPCTLFGDRDDEEEKRLFYVGMTRAKSGLILSHAARRSFSGRTLQMNPSAYVSLIPDSLCAPLERGAWKRKKRPHEQMNLF